MVKRYRTVILMNLSMSFDTNQLKLVSFRQVNYAIRNHVQCDKTPLITIKKIGMIRYIALLISLPT